jgi:APA family basic amino acid/polyamine antiporter
VSALFGPAAAKLIAAVILVSMFSAANGLTLTAPRMYYAMARDRVFFRKLGEVHPRFGTPAFAIVAGSLWAMVLAATGTFNQLLTYVVFSGLDLLRARRAQHLRLPPPRARRPSTRSACPAIRSRPSCSWRRRRRSC